MIILTRRALTKAESKIENGNFPTTVMLFNATVFEMKINKPTPRNVTQFSCQTIGAGEDRTFYLSLAMVTKIMWLFWPFEKSRDCFVTHDKFH